MSTIRSSKLPLAMICPASTVQWEEYALGSDSEAARLGTAVHEWMTGRLRGDSHEDTRLEVLSVKYGLEVDEVRPLALRAWKLWREIARWFPRPVCEVPVSHTDGDFTLTGTIDVLHYDEPSRTIFINDFKTGFLDSDHLDQIKGYGLLALKRFPGAAKVHLILCRVRDYCTDHHTFTREELDAWFLRVKFRLVEELHQYTPGRHCAYCSWWTRCPAYRDFTRGALQIVLDADGELEPSPTVYRKVYDAKKTLEKLCDSAGEALRSATLTAGGRLPFDDGYELVLTSQVRQEIVYDPALPILQNRLPADRLGSCFAVKKTAVQEAIKSTAGTGQKSAVVAALMQELADAGALSEKILERLEHKKQVPVITKEKIV